MDLSTATWALWMASYGLQVLLLVRLWQLGLWRRFRYLSTYYLLCVVETTILLNVEWGTDAYGWTYVSFVPIKCIASLLVVVEFHKLVLDGFHGLRTVGSW
ncbi:MAG: hypothetical protein GY953_50635, partial [bacterium]|nr:hypothetical protein [bacterium]